MREANVRLIAWRPVALVPVRGSGDSCPWGQDNGKPCAVNASGSQGSLTPSPHASRITFYMKQLRAFICTATAFPASAYLSGRIFFKRG